MNETRIRLGDRGRVVIPAKYRKALGLKPGDEVVLIIEEGEVRIVTKCQAIQRAQALVGRYVPKGWSLSEELICQRRQEAYRE